MSTSSATIAPASTIPPARFDGAPITPASPAPRITRIPPTAQPTTAHRGGRGPVEGVREVDGEGDMPGTMEGERVLWTIYIRADRQAPRTPTSGGKSARGRTAVPVDGRFLLGERTTTHRGAPTGPSETETGCCGGGAEAPLERGGSRRRRRVVRGPVAGDRQRGPSRPVGRIPIAVHPVVPLDPAQPVLHRVLPTDQAVLDRDRGHVPLLGPAVPRGVELLRPRDRPPDRRGTPGVTPRSSDRERAGPSGRSPPGRRSGTGSAGESPGCP